MAVVLLPGAMLRAGLYAMYDDALELRGGAGAADAAFATRTADHPLSNLHRFAGFDEIRAWERESLSASEGQKCEGSTGYQT